MLAMLPAGLESSQCSAAALLWSSAVELACEVRFVIEPSALASGCMSSCISEACFGIKSGSAIEPCIELSCVAAREVKPSEPGCTSGSSCASASGNSSSCISPSSLESEQNCRVESSRCGAPAVAAAVAAAGAQMSSAGCGAVALVAGAHEAVQSLSAVLTA